MTPTPRIETISDEVVEKVLNGLMGDTVALIHTMSPARQDEYLGNCRKHVRKVLADALGQEQGS